MNILTSLNPEAHLRLIGDVHGYLGSYFKVAGQVPCSLQVGDMGFDYKEFETCGLDPNNHKFIGGNHDNYSLKAVDDITVDSVAGNSRYTVVGYGQNNFAEQHVGFMDEVEEEPRVYEFHRMPPHYLGNYGMWQVPNVEPIVGGLSGRIFYVRGAWSIDGRWRRAKGGAWHWFPREQVSVAEGIAALELYESEKPDFVVTHEAPTFILNHLRLTVGEGKPIPTQTGHLFEKMLEVHKPKLWVFGHYHQAWTGKLDDTEFVCLNQSSSEGWTLDFDKNMRVIGLDEFETY